MAYVDGFILPLPTKNLAAYKKMAKQFARICRKHGVLQYQECLGDDLKVKHGLPYSKLLKLKKGESVIFAWMLYKSRAHRDKTLKAIMSDPSMTPPKSMPFEMGRMAWGGFKPIVGF